ncbi:SDR family NAD(P)-dependent oxidoreductase [Streptomyces sp. NPDC055239]
MHSRPLDGRRALVTGASRGIGKHIATALAEAGASVAITARTKNMLDEVAAAIEGQAVQAVALPADLAESGAGAVVVAGAADALGGLDIVVNNAAFGGLGRCEEPRSEDWSRALRLNVEAVAEVCAAAGPHLRKSGKGAIVNVTSIAALIGFPPAPHYAATKAAVISLTRSLAVHWAPANVRVNALCPGWTKTEMTRSWWTNSKASSAVLAEVPLARWADPQEMGPPAVFLASDAASYMTGQVLVIDGGRLAH